MAPLLLLAALAVPASAASLPDCIHVSTTSTQYRADLDSVRECQERTRQKMIDDADDAGKPLSNAQRDKLDDHHRAEVRKFLAATELTQTGSSLPAEPEEDENAPPSTAPDIKAGDAAEVLKLRKKLAGKRKVTPEAAGDIEGMLTKAQGGASADMKGLLDGAVKDGATPSPETLKKLLEAARTPTGTGLDAPIDDETAKGLEAAEKRLRAPVPEIDKR